MFFLCFFLFKQKTAYELRISDWSSDVCSSDLELDRAGQRVAVDRRFAFERHRHRHLHVHGPAQLVAVDLAIFDVERTHRAGVLAGEAVAVAADGENRFLVAHRRFGDAIRSEEHTSELQSLMRISYAVFCLKKKQQHTKKHTKQPY